MKLALVGSGEYLDPMLPIDRELLKRLTDPPRVVCLPTAAGTESADRIAYWARLGVDHFTQLGVPVETVPVLTRDDAQQAAFADSVAAANFVYLSGGKPDYLQRCLVDTPVWAAIRQVLDRGGLLAGCSAGAMIMGSTFFGFPGSHDGFNLLPGTSVIPHFDEIPGALNWVMRQFMGRRQAVVGIDGNTALVRDGDAYEVVGRGGVTLWRNGRHDRYEAGPLPAGLFPSIEEQEAAA